MYRTKPIHSQNYNIFDSSITMARLASRSVQDDHLLWTQFREGSVQAWGLLIDHYHHVLFNYGLRFGVDRESLHDCVQDLFLDLWDGRQRLNADVENVPFYLLRAFRHKLIKQKQKERTYQELTDTTTDQFQDPPFETWLTNQEATQLNGLRLKKLINSLPARQQEVLYLKYYANLGNKEIAELMSLQPQSVANLLHVALDRLRSQWGVSSSLPSLVLLPYLFA